MQQYILDQKINLRSHPEIIPSNWKF